ncbi:ATP-binding response regulator [Pirellulaceae bacterium SH467]
MNSSHCPRLKQDRVVEMSEQPTTLRPKSSEEEMAMLGHELRNPLSAITYALEVWPTSREDPQLENRLLEIMRRQVKQLTRLCDDLLGIGQRAKERKSIHRKSMDLRSSIWNASEEVRPFAESFGHTLSVDLGNQPIWVLGDESRLTQVFANLMHNAVKFTDRGGQISISAEQDAGALVIRLSDNGRGIGAERLSTIFGTEGSSENHGFGAGEGLGIGLRLAKSIVEQHGGTIEASSEGLGRGSTFSIKLPLTTKPQTDLLDDSQAESLPKQEVDPNLPIFRILVVDDDRSIRFLVSALLNRMHQEVSVAENGEQAIELVHRIRPDIVIVDLHMRGIDGFEVARRLRSQVDLQGIVLIALSGSSDAATLKRAADSGFDQYMIKPIGLKELTNKLLHVARTSLCSY